MLKKFWDQYDQIIGTILFVGVLFVFIYRKTQKVKEEGVITVAKLTRFAGAESGSSLYIEIYLDNKTYKTSVNSEFEKGGIGKYYFIKVLRNDPTEFPFLYGEKQVPSCIMENVKEFKGWSQIPDCDNYLKFAK